MRSQYAATPNPAPPTLTAIAGSTTIASAKTYWCWIYARTRGGITGFSTSKTIAIAIGQGLRVTIPAAVITVGGEFLSIGVVLGVNDNAANGCVVATVLRSATFPTSVDLIRDEHFGLNKSVLTVAALPNALNAINGMRRYIDATNKIVEYASANNSWVNCVPQVFNPWVSSRLTEEPDGRRGCDRDLADITNYSTVVTPEYATDGSLSESVNYWIVNDGTTNVRQGTRIRLAIATDTFDSVSDDFKGLCRLSFLGYVNTSTGELDTSGMQLGTYDYQGDIATNLVTEKALLPRWAYAIAIRMKFSDYEINNRVSQGETVKVYPRFAAEYSAYDPGGRDLGDRLYNSGGLRRLLPDGKGLFLEAQSGEGSVGEYRFPLLESQPVTGLAANTANIQIAISNTGVCYPTSTTLPSSTAALRAVVSTVNGAGLPGSWSAPIALTPTTLLSISLTHPLIIRSNYPDVIAGTPALLNADTIRVYVRISGQTSIQYFDIATLGLDETITIGSVATGVLSGLPVPASSFGLFAAPTVNSQTTESGSSVFTTNNYEFAVSYYYQDTVTSISHSPSIGCVRELLTDIIDSLAIADSWGSVLALGTYAIIDDAIRNAPIPSDGQVRNLDSRAIIRADSPLIYYDAFSTEAERTTVGDRVWLPVGRNLATPGRWKTKVALTGPAGSQIFTDDIAPVNTLGANNDLYINTITGDLFQKITGTWVLQGNIKGVDGSPGAMGAPGSQILVGAGAPANSLGVDGDLYINATSSAYFKKISGAWVSQGNLRGATGAAGTLAIGTVTSLPAGSTPTVTNTGTATAAILNIAIPNGAVGVEATANFTTPSLVPNTPTLFSVPLSQVVLFISATTSSNSRIRCYQNAATANADIMRGFDVNTIGVEGLVFDFQNKSSHLFSGSPTLVNAESPRTVNGAIVITNTGASSVAITITLTYYSIR